MRRGKHICETLKGLRCEIAKANGIDYHPTECNHEGDCKGTCPKCESETRWLERQLRLRQKLGKAVTIAGLSVALGAGATSCDFVDSVTAPVRHIIFGERVTEGDVPDSTNVLEGEVADSSLCMPDSANVLEGEVADSSLCMPENEIISKAE